MSLLLLTPTWQRPSELWMIRMFAALRADLAAVATTDAVRGDSVEGVPLVPLAPRDAEAPRWRRALRRVASGLPGWRPARVADRLRAALRRYRIRRVLVHYLDFALTLRRVWETTDVEVFVYVHGYDTEWDLRCEDRPAERRFPPDYRAAARALAERALLLANSHGVICRLAAAGIPAHRRVYQPYGIAVPATLPMRPPRTRGLRVLYLGRLVDCKGPDLTIRAFERACEQGLDATLDMAGDGYLRTTCELLRRRSRFADRIRLLGAVDAATGARLRAESDLFTAHNCRGPLTGQEESFGVAVVEALGAGLPVITGRSGGVCETVQSGVSGLLFEPGDVEAHAAALLALARDPERRARYGQAGHAFVKRTYDPGQRWAELRATLGLGPPPGDGRGPLNGPGAEARSRTPASVPAPATATPTASGAAAP